MVIFSVLQVLSLFIDPSCWNAECALAPSFTKKHKSLRWIAFVALKYVDIIQH